MNREFLFLGAVLVAAIVVAGAILAHDHFEKRAAQSNEPWRPRFEAPRE